MFRSDLRAAVRRRDLEPCYDDHGRACDGKPHPAATDIDAVTDSVGRAVTLSVANTASGVDADRTGSGSRAVLRGR